MGSLLFFAEGNLRYRFHDDHPFRPQRLRLTMDLIETSGLLPPTALRRPRPATHAELQLAHTDEYIAAVERLSAPGAECHEECFGLGTADVPIFAGMHDAAALSVGGTLGAVAAVLAGEAEHAFHLAGGHHHAQRALASGFCIYNDINVAIEWATRHHRARVLYIDNDAHHGDGVQAAFERRADVMTISFHESGRYLYPGTGFVDEIGHDAGHGRTLNVPLEPFTDDRSWLDLFAAVVPAAARHFRPDLIVLQNGCDGHHDDPLTHLSATTRTIEGVVSQVHALAHELCAGRLVMLGGGGYDIWRVVPRAWTLSWALLSDQVAPELVPAAWRARWQPVSPVPLPTRLRDEPADYPPLARQPAITAANARTLQHLRDRLPAVLGDPFDEQPPARPNAGW